jgi:hypothetical protein
MTIATTIGTIAATSTVIMTAMIGITTAIAIATTIDDPVAWRLT